MGDNNEGVQLEFKDRSIQPVWKDDIGEYLQDIKGCGSLAIEKREQYYKKKMEKSASTTKSIVYLFLARFNKNQSRDNHLLSVSLSTIFLLKNTEKKVREIRFESQT